MERSKEEDVYQSEAEKAISVEKSIIQYRLFVLYTIATTRVKELRIMAKALYNKLDDWIIYSIKTENEAVNEQVRHI